ncbi:MAG: sensor histidine kinase, partial [Sphingobacteriales bacterium]
QEMLNEKLRISGELHDNIGSQLSFIHSSIQNLRTDPDQGTRSDLQETENIAVNAIRDLRQTVWFINNSSFTADDFVIRLREYIKPYQQINNLAIAISNEVPADVVLSSATATHLFRILQEAINNAIKYAGASEIDIQLRQDGKDSMVVSINDNGQGFDTTQHSNGFGLRNMKDRAQRSGGKLAITSAPDKGTSVEVSVPV